MKFVIKGFKDDLNTFFACCTFPNPIRIDESINARTVQALHSKIPYLIYAARDCKETVTYMLTQFNDISGHHIDNSVFECIDRMDKRFIGACSDLTDVLDKKLQHFFVWISQQARVWEGVVHTISVDPNATEAAPVVSPENAQPRDHLVLSSQGQGNMESDTGHGDEADASEEHKTAVPRALVDLGS